MHDQVTRLVKRPATLYTVMWLFTSMRAGLHGQATRLVTLKRLAILYTLIWFFDCVSMEVYGQVTRLVKRLFAHCVHTHMVFSLV